MRGHSRWLAGSTLALAIGLLTGCNFNDTNTRQDQRTGRGNGDLVPTTGVGAEGTNGSATDVTVDGPGSKKTITDNSGYKPGQSTPYGGDGAGAAPPVTPSKNTAPSGESNGGQMTADQQTVGGDASLNKAMPAGNLGGPGTGEPPK